MKTHARVVIIGGGIVGVSTAYHLAKLGWHDVVVVDMGPLFHNLGSTSHAPGIMFQHHNSKAVCTLAMWSVATYLQAEAEAGAGRLIFQTGGLEIAHTAARWHELKRKLGNARAWGLEAHLIGPDDVQKLVPIMRTDDLYGAFYVPSDLDLRGVKLLEAMAAVAGRSGVTFEAHTAVTGIDVHNGRAVAVQTSRGRIAADYIVCAAGLWGPVVARMAGLTLPMTPCQHLYAKTSPVPALKGETEEVRHPVIRYQDKDMYFRQHGEGYGFGSYAHAPRLVFAEDLPNNDHPAKFPAEADQLQAAWDAAVDRFPALAPTHITESFNGCFSFTTDGHTFFGETPQVRNFIVAEAVWVTHAGGTAQAVAQLLVHGDPGLDLRELDVNRLPPHAGSRAYLKARAERQYSEVYDIVHPLQPLADPRPLRVGPYYPRLKELGGFFTESAGWERPLWFAANEKLLHGQPIDWPLRQGWAARFWSPLIGAEHRAVRARAGLFDLSNFYKIEVSGPGALAFLQQMAANQMDQPVGRATYTAMLTERGGIQGDVTVTRLAADTFWVITGGGTGPMDLAWLLRHAPTNGAVQIRHISSAWTTLGVWGPRARDIVQAVSAADWSNAAFPYLTLQDHYLGHIPVMALRVSYAGELGWELYTPTEYGLALWDTLWEAGQPHGLIAAGGGAFDSLRLEKGYRQWGADIHTDYNPYEAGLGFAVRLKKGDFLGRAALEQVKAAGPRRQLCCLVCDDPRAALLGKEPVFAPGGDQALGYVTSANYGYSVNQSLAYSYLPIEYAAAGTRVEVYFFGDRFSATVSREPRFDPENTRLKA
ncbi:MAG: FAD-dependent oxidoreductase [Anaerolineales bacterium]|nr:FAD-dependent oxidoreductase [Anaerolineales bacterium]